MLFQQQLTPWARRCLNSMSPANLALVESAFLKTFVLHVPPCAYTYQEVRLAQERLAATIHYVRSGYVKFTIAVIEDLPAIIDDVQVLGGLQDALDAVTLH